MMNSSPPQRAMKSSGSMNSPESSYGALEENLVPGPMAKAVVDLLEIVEIEKQDGQGLLAGTRLVQRVGKRGLESVAIGQSGDGVEMRHVLDLSLGVEAVGDILNDEDGAFGVHGVDGQLDGAAIACLDIYGGVRTEALVREEGLVAQHILRVGDELRNGFAEKGVDVASCQQRLGRERHGPSGTCR